LPSSQASLAVSSPSPQLSRPPLPPMPAEPPVDPPVPPVVSVPPVVPPVDPPVPPVVPPVPPPVVPPPPASPHMLRLAAYATLTEPDHRAAFLRTVHAVIEPGGQAVSATDRLYLAAAMPTLIVWGDADPIIPVSHGVAAHDAMPGSRLEIFEGVGHFPHAEDPARFTSVLLDFLATTEPASDPDAAFELLRRSALTG